MLLTDPWPSENSPGRKFKFENGNSSCCGGPLKAATMKIVAIDRYGTGPPRQVNLLFIVIKLTQQPKPKPKQKQNSCIIRRRKYTLLHTLRDFYGRNKRTLLHFTWSSQTEEGGLSLGSDIESEQVVGGRDEDDM